jgi:hypothetical protein
MKVNIELRNGSVLLNCCTYPEEVRNGDSNILDRTVIEEMFNKVPWGFKYIRFQNEDVKGKVHVNNVERYWF